MLTTYASVAVILFLVFTRVVYTKEKNAGLAATWPSSLILLIVFGFIPWLVYNVLLRGLR